MDSDPSCDRSDLVVSQAAASVNVDRRNVWPAIVLALGTFAGAIVALALKIPVTDIMGILAVIAVPVSGALLYGKISTVQETANQVQQQTNGSNTALMQMVDGMLEHFKTHTLPVSPETLQSTTQEIPVSDGLAK